jgi:outer membrane protein
VAVRASYFHDILGVSDGSGATISISHRFPISEKFSLSPFLGTEWQSKRLVNYYYGVRPEEATASRPEYHGRDSINLYAGVFGAYRLTSTWTAFGSVSLKRLDDGIADSPIVLDRYGVFGFVGAGWRF